VPLAQSSGPGLCCQMSAARLWGRGALTALVALHQTMADSAYYPKCVCVLIQPLQGIGAGSTPPPSPCCVARGMQTPPTGNPHALVPPDHNRCLGTGALLLLLLLLRGPLR
jgi:hypothetical protein